MNTIEQAKKLSNTLKMHPTVGLEADAANTIDALLAELAALKAQEPVAVVKQSALFDGVTIVEYEDTASSLTVGSELFLAAGAQPVQELLDEIAAQRKVLEQALEVLVNHGSPYMGLHIKYYEAAITAIQGVLK